MDFPGGRSPGHLLDLLVRRLARPPLQVNAKMSISPQDESVRLADLQKGLAEIVLGTEARVAMRMVPRSPNRRRAFTSALVSVAFLWTLALAGAPRLHEQIHKVLGAQHECAVTMVSSGNYDHSAHPPLVSAPVPAVQFSRIPTLTQRWVESPFLGACIFEHAPPAHS